jgi:hypothetical protein
MIIFAASADCKKMAIRSCAAFTLFQIYSEQRKKTGAKTNKSLYLFSHLVRFHLGTKLHVEDLELGTGTQGDNLYKNRV